MVVICLDEHAAEDVSAAIGEALGVDRPRESAGRRFVAVEGMEASLTDARRKARVWQQLQAAAPPGPVY